MRVAVGRFVLSAALAAGAALTAAAPEATAATPTWFDIPGINGVTIHACRLGPTDRPRPVVLEWTNYILDDPYSEPAAGCPPQLKDLSAELVRRGYVYVAAQTRGVGASTGTADTWSVQDGKDGAAVVEWLARQPWSTGKVGLAGCSSSAQEGMQVVVQAPPHLGAAAIACVAPDSYRDAFYPGGLRAYSVGPVASRPLVDLDPYALQARGQRGDDAAIATESAQRAVVDAKFEQHVLADDTVTDFWRTHSTVDHLAARKAAMLLYGSWADFFLRGTTELARSLRPEDRLVLVPGWHGSPTTQTGRYGMTQRAAAFFDNHLRGLADPYRSDRRVVWWEQPGGQFFGASPLPDRWRQATAWPPAGVRYTRTALPAADGRALLARPSLAPAATTDPRGFGQTSAFSAAAEQQGAVASYTLPALAAPLRLAGPVTVTLKVLPATPELDLYVRLVAVAKDGSFTDITNGWLRGTQSALDPARTLRDPRSGLVIRPYHRHAATTLLTPGSPVEFAVELWQTGTEVPRGSSLRVLVTAEDAPWTVPSSGLEAGQVLAGHVVLPVLG